MKCNDCRRRAMVGRVRCADCAVRNRDKHRARSAPAVEARRAARAAQEAAVKVERLSPREKQAWAHRVAGRSAHMAAALMGTSVVNVMMLWRLARRRKERKPPPEPTQQMATFSRKMAALDALGRCWCGFLNDGHDHDGLSAVAVAQGRR